MTKREQLKYWYKAIERQEEFIRLVSGCYDPFSNMIREDTLNMIALYHNLIEQLEK